MRTKFGNTPPFFLTRKLQFPPAEHTDPEGLLAIGGDLSPERLLLAYRSGIFPWFNEDCMILWWSPDPRMVFSRKTLKFQRVCGKC